MNCRARTSWAAALLAAATLATASVRAQALEHAVKATFVYKLAAFVEWPAETFDGPQAPLVICVAGEPVAALVDEATRGQALGSRPIVVRRLGAPAQAGACHIVFVGGPRADMAGYLQAARGKPVLTITDDADDARAKGVVNFVVRDNRVRFEIDLDKAAQQHLALSSKLASLAVNVLPLR